MQNGGRRCLRLLGGKLGANHLGLLRVEHMACGIVVLLGVGTDDVALSQEGAQGGGRRR
jgi:hypothetical protein